MLNICSVEHLEVKQSECLIYEIFVWSLFKIRSNAQRSLILAFVHQEQKSTVIGTDNYCFIIFKRRNLIENCFFLRIVLIRVSFTKPTVGCLWETI